LEEDTYESSNAGASVVVMPWGGSKGSALTAYQTLADQGADLGWYYTMFINPLPPRLLEELRGKELVIVPELNYMGQFASVLRTYGVNAEAITQYTGLPFKVADLIDRIREKAGLQLEESVTA